MSDQQRTDEQKVPLHLQLTHQPENTIGDRHDPMALPSGNDAVEMVPLSPMSDKSVKFDPDQEYEDHETDGVKLRRYQKGPRATSGRSSIRKLSREWRRRRKKGMRQ